MYMSSFLGNPLQEGGCVKGKVPLENKKGCLIFAPEYNLFGTLNHMNAFSTQELSCFFFSSTVFVRGGGGGGGRANE